MMTRECNATTASGVIAELRETRSAASPCIFLQTLIILIPLFYNQNGDAERLAIEPVKVKQTEGEIRRYFTGYSRYQTDGWYRDVQTGEESCDLHLRFEIDDNFTLADVAFLKKWKQTLEHRFEQRSIYMKLLVSVVCL